MTNPVRSAEHFARADERRTLLRGTISRALPAQKRFVWEVGCGHGHFLAGYAATHPETTCIGIDIARERIIRAIRKRDRAKLDHLHFVHADANDFLGALPPTVTFSSIFILFPDPWPKRRHHKNRLLQSLFLDRVHERAAEGTRLYFRTDHAPYFSEVSATVETHPKWERVNDPWPFELETVFQARAASYQSLVAAPKFSHKIGEKNS
ncbi:MAG TPA: tRNA (guanosine(46)-N7)-methyltransferase TrmB [Opitutaceae bacterium]|nr:tRNA (guanosine(46)-N7)-methyltransferase TrmB [Opitutaceae bacterium]